jgi:hypothetical protein
MGFFEAVLGRIYNDGVELERGGGIECKNGVQATRNSTTRRIELSANGAEISKASYDYRGNYLEIPADVSPAYVALPINGAAATLDLSATLPDEGDAMTIRAWIWRSEDDGTNARRDELHVGLKNASTNVVFDAKSTAASANPLTLTGGSSGQSYRVAYEASGAFSISAQEDSSTDYVYQCDLYLSSVYDVPDLS